DSGTFGDDIIYLIMEYIEGISLHDVLKEVKRFDIAQAIRYMGPICAAVEAAHEKNIVHRDLKPSNIMLVNYGQPDEKVKVIDFSIAKLVETDNPDNLTAKGVVLGTPQYISPEQAQGFGIEKRSDIYSLGVILYHMLTGSVPFNANTPV